MIGADNLSSTVLGMSVDAAAATCVAALRSAGVDSILLKGPAIAHWLGAPRRYQDADLLVPTGSVELALEVLGKLGYVDAVPDQGERLRIEPPHARALVPSDVAHLPPCAIDLHSTFHGVSAPPDRFWQVVSRGATTIRMFGTDVRIPGREVMALIVGIHAGRPRESEQATLDLERAIEVLPADTWEGVASLARELGADNHLAIGLRARPSGSDLADALCLPQGSDLKVALIASGAPGMSYGLHQLSESGGLRRRAVILSRALVPTPTYMRKWLPLANHGRLGLAAAYAWRPFSLLGRLPRSLIALRRARAETARRAR